MPHNIRIQLSYLGDILRSWLKAKWLNQKLQRLKRKAAPVPSTAVMSQPFRDHRDAMIEHLQERLKISEERNKALEDGHRIWMKLYLILIGFVRLKHVETKREAVLQRTGFPAAIAIALGTLFGTVAYTSYLNKAPAEPASIQVDQSQDPSSQMDAEFVQFDASLPAGRESGLEPPAQLICYEPFVTVVYRARLERPNQCMALPEREIYSISFELVRVPCGQNPPFR